jgi:hypothetical protein
MAIYPQSFFLAATKNIQLFSITRSYLSINPNFSRCSSTHTSSTIPLSLYSSIRIDQAKKEIEGLTKGGTVLFSGSFDLTAPETLQSRVSSRYADLIEQSPLTFNGVEIYNLQRILALRDYLHDEHEATRGLLPPEPSYKRSPQNNLLDDDAIIPYDDDFLFTTGSPNRTPWIFEPYTTLSAPEKALDVPSKDTTSVPSKDTTDASSSDTALSIKRAQWFSMQYSLVNAILNYTRPSRFAVDESGRLMRQITAQTRKGALGRLYADGVSAQLLSKEVRSFLFADSYYDFDIVNSCYSILASYASMPGSTIQVPAIREYVDNRDSFLQEKAIADSSSLSDAKTSLIVLANARSYSHASKLGHNCSKIYDEILKLRLSMAYTLGPAVDPAALTAATSPSISSQALLQLGYTAQQLYYNTEETTAMLQFYCLLHESMQAQPSSSKRPLLSFVPIFDGALVQLVDCPLRLPDVVKQYNDLMTTRHKHIKIKLKPLEAVYENIDINVLNKYLTIRQLFDNLDGRKLTKLLKHLGITPKLLDINSSTILDEDTARLHALDVAKTYRDTVYKKLLEFTAKQLEAFVEADFSLLERDE